MKVIPANELRERFPGIPWDEPIRVSFGSFSRLCCRICIAQVGLKARDIEMRGFTSLRSFEEHMTAAHGS